MLKINLYLFTKFGQISPNLNTRNHYKMILPSLWLEEHSYQKGDGKNLLKSLTKAKRGGGLRSEPTFHNIQHDNHLILIKVTVITKKLQRKQMKNRVSNVFYFHQFDLMHRLLGRSPNTWLMSVFLHMDVDKLSFLLNTRFENSCHLRCLLESKLFAFCSPLW